MSNKGFISGKILMSAIFTTGTEFERFKRRGETELGIQSDNVNPA
jgi:hypothetical protein